MSSVPTLPQLLLILLPSKTGGGERGQTCIPIHAVSKTTRKDTLSILASYFLFYWNRSTLQLQHSQWLQPLSQPLYQISWPPNPLSPVQSGPGCSNATRGEQYELFCFHVVHEGEGRVKMNLSFPTWPTGCMAISITKMEKGRSRKL